MSGTAKDPTAPQGEAAIPCWRGMLPPPLAALRDLALDLRWTWSHRADAL